jgi:hypothetical protein
MNIHTSHITNRVTVGSCKTDYRDFDIIVNLDYPQNGVKKDEISYQQEDGKHVIRCGYDDVSFYTTANGSTWQLLSSLTHEKIETLLSILASIEKPADRILFHCRVGISRSPTVAVFYLATHLGISPLDAYHMVKEKRPLIEPNKAFKVLIGLLTDDGEFHSDDEFP